MVKLMKNPSYATDYNLKKFRTRRQMLQILKNSDPSQFDMGNLEEERDKEK